jgi:hypothetical protein
MERIHFYFGANLHIPGRVRKVKPVEADKTAREKEYGHF